MKKKLSIIASVFALSTLVSPSAVAQEEHSWQFSEVSGNKIAWSCLGEGQPTIILIAGSGLTAHASFGRIYHSYDGRGRICMYDRAGLGESVLSEPKTRALDELVEELHSLTVANSWGDAVLVAHSFGGFIARAYTHKYPGAAQAILFVDVTHEDWLPRLKNKMNSSDWAIMERILAWNERTFHEDYLQAQEAVRTTKLRSRLPIGVLSRGIPHTSIRTAKMSYEGIDIFEKEHNALQAKIVGLSADSEHRTARYSSHIFNDYDPWIVIEEIKRLIERLPEKS